ncbi:MAG TPA: MFS transporter [Acidobacteriota bacterium]|nr:MFS transporter [Acidobacteriota bacterium]
MGLCYPVPVMEFDTHAVDPSEQRATIVIAIVASFLTPFMGSAINIALPSIGAEFHMDAITLSWVATIYLLTASVLLIPFGKWADMHGRKAVFLTGTFVYSLASLGISLVFSTWLLIVLRGLQGVGAAMIFATGMAILTSVTPPSRRGRILGVNVAAVYLGLSLGPSLGGVLTQQLGWRSLFLLNVLMGTVIIVLVLTRVRGDKPEVKHGSFDWLGSVLYCSSFVALLHGVSCLPSRYALFETAVGALLFGVFLRFEAQSANPIVELSLFKNNTVYAFSNLAALINYAATAAVAFLLSLYLQDVLGMSPQNAGILLVVQPAVMALLSPIAGALSDRMEPGRVASLGMALIAIALASFTVAGNDTSIRFVIVDLLLLGAGFALFSSPNTNAVMSSVERRSYGIASATLGTMRLTGQMLSMAIVMLIFALKMESGPPPAQQTEAFLVSMRIGFAVFSVLCVGGIFASLARGRLR